MVEYKDFRNALNEIYNSPQGKTVFDYLKENYIDQTCFDSDTNTMVYKLAHKEFVQSFLLEAEQKYEDLSINAE